MATSCGSTCCGSTVTVPLGRSGYGDGDPGQPGPRPAWSSTIVLVPIVFVTACARVTSSSTSPTGSSRRRRRPPAGPGRSGPRAVGSRRAHRRLHDLPGVPGVAPRRVAPRPGPAPRAGRGPPPRSPRAHHRPAPQRRRHPVRRRRRDGHAARAALRGGGGRLAAAPPAAPRRRRAPVRPGVRPGAGGRLGFSLVCGRNEGVDQSVADHLATAALDGDFVLAGARPRPSSCSRP